MRAENPAALRYILQDDIYLLPNDKATLQAQPEITQVIHNELVHVSPVDIRSTDPVALPPVEVNQTEPVVALPVNAINTQTPAPAYNYQGKNKKQFLILTHYVNEEHIAADHLTALQNILKRKDYELDDVAIFNVAKTAFTIIDIVNYFKPQRVLILGEAAVPKGMGVPPLNQPKKMKNGVLLRSFDFDEMMSSNDNKKAFWDQMKNL